MAYRKRSSRSRRRGYAGRFKKRRSKKRRRRSTGVASILSRGGIRL